MIKFWWGVMLSAIIVFSPQMIVAESEGILNKLLAPGPLISAHKDLEGKDCLKCHSAGKGIADSKCLDCHKDIKKFVDSKKGFHGINNQSCIKCHSDHKGREFDSTRIDLTNFNHSKMTGYLLEGKHAKLKCAECHKETRSAKLVRRNEIRFLGQASTCVSCHKKDDIHFFKGDFAKKDCNFCHSNVSWKSDIKFNHNTDTRFKLVEKHAELKCADCHNPEKKSQLSQYHWPHLEEKQCLSCHQDFHKKNLSSRFAGGNCVSCHSQQSWKIAQFDHAVTKFKLNGKHAEIACIDCHKVAKANIHPNMKIETKNLNFTGLKTQCLSCHEDFHKFGLFKSKSFGNLNNCVGCHSETSWKQTPNFDHNRDTHFKIEGEHLGLKCASCHLPNPKNLKTDPKNLFLVKSPTYHWEKIDAKTCETCHKNPHIGVFSPKLLSQKCTVCHVAEGWSIPKAGTGFDHSKTRFALTGAHRSTKCSDCHGPPNHQVFKFKSVDSQFCIDCHSNIHTTQFSPKFSAQSCTVCHSTESFSQRLDFDHSQTSYPLKGLHLNLKCADCHKVGTTTLNLKWPNFKSKNHGEVSPVHPAQFLFPAVKERSCLACHADYHKGQLPANCSQCHSENGWKPVQFNHNTQSRFKLAGSHEQVECIKCHVPTKVVVAYKNELRPVIRYKPLKTACVDCHTDFHKGQLSKNCNQCHTEKAWRETLFNHNKNSAFILRGKHEKVDCFKCHLPTRDTIKWKDKTMAVTRFKPLSSACADCHKDPHRGNFGKSCQECHTENEWKVTKDFHRNFTLTGVHYTLDCKECHKEGKKLSGLSQSCLACHLKDDVHNGTLPDCKSCHTQHFWEASHFRHSLTQFPLRGAHRTLDCAECHTNGVYKGLSSSCVTCHLQVYLANPGPHTSGNTNCTDCHHNTFTFKSAN